MDHTPRTLILSRSAVIAALAIAFALVLGTALLSSFAARDLARHDELGSSAKQAVSATTQLLATIANAEAALDRTEDATVAGKTAGAIAAAQLREDVLGFASQFSARPDLRPYVEQLESLTRPTGAAASPLAASAPAAVLANYAEMRRILYALQRQEFAVLVEHSASAATRARRIQSMNAGLIVVALVLAATCAWLLLRRIRDLDGLITVCAWTRRVKWQGRWITFEEYLARRFNVRCTHGISDEAAERMRAEVAKAEVPSDLRHV